MQNKQTAWLLYNEARAWRTSPSKLLAIDDWYTGYCFDQAINYWGSYVESELDKVEGKDSKATHQARQTRLQGLLAEGDTPSSGQFADPALLFN